MDDIMETNFTTEYTDTRANLNYEILLGRAVDRCLHYRVVDPLHTFFVSVQALDIALVDLPGKPLRLEFDTWVAGQSEYPGAPHTLAGVCVYDVVFKMITRVLSKYHMLFKSTVIEANR